jgi:hypothetical protein
MRFSKMALTLVVGSLFVVMVRVVMFLDIFKAF